MLCRDLQYHRTRLRTDVLDEDLFLPHVGRERKKHAQESHTVHVVLPYVEAISSKVDGDGAMTRSVIV